MFKLLPLSHCFSWMTEWSVQAKPLSVLIIYLPEFKTPVSHATSTPLPTGRLLFFSNWMKDSLNSIVAVAQVLSCVWLFATPRTAARQASLSFTNSWSLLRLVSIESVMPSHHLILCRPLLLPPSFFPSVRAFSSESALCISYFTVFKRFTQVNSYKPMTTLPLPTPVSPSPPPLTTTGVFSVFESLCLLCFVH